MRFRSFARVKMVLSICSSIHGFGQSARWTLSGTQSWSSISAPSRESCVPTRSSTPTTWKGVPSSRTQLPMRALRAEQPLAHALAEHQHAPAMLHVLVRDQAPRGERHVADRLALGLDAAHLDRERAPAEGGRRMRARLGADQIALAHRARSAATSSGVYQSQRRSTAGEKSSEILPGPGLHQVLARALEGGVEHGLEARPHESRKITAAVPHTRPNSVRNERSGCAARRRSASRSDSKALTRRFPGRSRSRRRGSRCGAAGARRCSGRG